jgi:hypothetical protein
MAITSLVIVDQTKSMGINHMDDSRLCRVTFKADIEKAKVMEKDINGPHELTKLCYVINQGNASGEPLAIHYTVKPSGEQNDWVITFQKFED